MALFGCVSGSLLGLRVDDYVPGTQASSRSVLAVLAALLGRVAQVRGRFGVLADIYRHGKGLVASGAGAAWVLDADAAGVSRGGRVRKVVGRFALLTVITYRGRVFPLQFVGGNGVPNPDVTEGDRDG